MVRVKSVRWFREDTIQRAVLLDQLINTTMPESAQASKSMKTYQFIFAWIYRRYDGTLPQLAALSMRISRQ